ncbi:hypothetical protein CB0940_07472 [Cercospora beticola]|uniref:Uncharacterized protein n=2 Tax=Cercospora beticola TaxID=122368 RepID=A0A2G5H8J0_CERBT|nr:hypothetical protein CB0940_07472 [Cercospora beticola]PIA88849.1 hypothetical protein CB0940_07472 [Cercospora beticola]
MKSPSTNNFFRNNALPHIITTPQQQQQPHASPFLFCSAAPTLPHTTTTKPPHRTTKMSANSTELQKKIEQQELMIEWLTTRSVERDNTIASLTHRLQIAQINEQNSRNERVNQALGYQANEQKLLERVKKLEQEKTQLVEVMDEAAKEFDFLPEFASKVKEVKDAVMEK